MKSKIVMAWFVVAVTVSYFLTVGCSTAPTREEPVAADRELAGESSVPANVIGQYPKPSSVKDLQWLGVIPDSELTPGMVDACQHAFNLCHTTTKERRHTSKQEKGDVARAYLIKYNQAYVSMLAQGPQRLPNNFEIDHLIPLDIGGADVEQNLWPQALQSTVGGASDKDDIEKHAKSEMCHILETKGEDEAESYLAMMQRVISSGFTYNRGHVIAPRFSWYNLFYADVLPNKGEVTYTGSGRRRKSRGGAYSFYATMLEHKREIMDLPEPAHPISNCQMPQIQ